MSGNDTNTKVLLHFNGTDGSTTITDHNVGGSAHTWTASGNAQIDTAQSKFGGASLLLDGSGDFVSAADHADFEIGGDYTIDCWIRANAFGADKAIVSKSDSVGVGKYFGPYVIRYETASGNLVFYSSSDGANWDIANARSFGAISTATWYHIAVVRSGNDYFLFKDGVQQTTWTSSLTPVNNTENIQIGRFVDTNDWNGWIEEFRLSNTARWTSGFTPPTAQYSYDLVPSLYSDADTFQTPKVSHKIYPSLFSDADTFFSPRLNLKIFPSLYSDTDSFFSPTVTRGAVNLSPSLYSDADTFFTPTVSHRIYPSLFTDGDTFFTHIIGVEQFLTVPYLAKHAYVAMVRNV
jgi:hypothetical protein